MADMTLRVARRIVVTIVGATVVLIGVIMLITPGPAFVVIPIGLAILGLEWAWARRLLRKVKEQGGEALQRVGLADRLRTWWSGVGDKTDPSPRTPEQGD
ncbi:MAG: hypothetical protein GKS06_14335 [Acidobacteria bacterium]|nr:hypothetical protein [Acidobacteriota bacterium]